MDKSSLILSSKDPYLSISSIDIPQPIITFSGSDGEEILRLEGNGDISVHGKLIENDKEVVDGLRLFLSSHNIGKL